MTWILFLQKTKKIRLGFDLTKNHLNSIFHSLESNTIVTTLDISCQNKTFGIRLSNIEMKNLCEMLERNKTLKELDIANNTLRPQDIQLFFKALSKNKTLKTIDMRCKFLLFFWKLKKNLIKQKHFFSNIFTSRNKINFNSKFNN